MTDAQTLIAGVRARLAAASPAIPQELLGEWRTPRRILGVPRAARIEPVARAWRVGALLIATEGVAAVGEVVRAAEEVRRGYTAESARARADVRAAAARGGVPEGASIHVGWTELDFEELEVTGSAGPLVLVDGVPHIRWSSAGGLMPLDGYLRERVGLLLGEA